MKRLVGEVVDRCGGIDILVNNAGLYASLEMRPFEQIPLEEWRQVMDVNVASMFLMCREVVPVMRGRGGGKIVNISSGTPFRGVPFLLHYVTSKGAIVTLTRALAKELGKDNILVNCVAPGFTMSAGVEAHPEVIEKLRDVSVAARTLQRDQVPEDVVGAVVFLCGPGSDFVTGQTMVIDGGPVLQLILRLTDHPDGVETGAGDHVVYDVDGDRAYVGAGRVAGPRARLGVDRAAGRSASTALRPRRLPSGRCRLPAHASGAWASRPAARTDPHRHAGHLARVRPVRVVVRDRPRPGVRRGVRDGADGVRPRARPARSSGRESGRSRTSTRPTRRSRSCRARASISSTAL